MTSRAAGSIVFRPKAEGRRGRSENHDSVDGEWLFRGGRIEPADLFDLPCRPELSAVINRRIFDQALSPFLYRVIPTCRYTGSHRLLVFDGGPVHQPGIDFCTNVPILFVLVTASYLYYQER